MDATTINYLAMKTFSIIVSLAGLALAVLAVAAGAYHQFVFVAILEIVALAHWAEYKGQTSKTEKK